MMKQANQELTFPLSTLDIDWINKVLMQLALVKRPFHSPESSIHSNPDCARNVFLRALWQSVLPTFKAKTSTWWISPNVNKDEKTSKDEEIVTFISPQQSFLLALSRLAFLLPESEHAEVGQLLANFASAVGQLESGSGSANSNFREPWLTEAAIKLMAQNLQYYDRVLKHSSKVDLLEWICDRMSAVTVADTSSFTGPLLHYLQDLLDDLYNLHPPLKKKKSNSHLNLLPFANQDRETSEEEVKIALLYKISKVAFWINYLLGPKSTSKKSSSSKKIKQLEVVEQMSEESSTDDEQVEEKEKFTIYSDITVEEDEQFVDANEFPVEDNAESFSDFTGEGQSFSGPLQQREGEDNSTSATSEGFMESTAFEVRSVSSLGDSEILNQQQKVELRIRRYLYRQLRRLCRNVQKDCDYQLEKCGH